MAEIRPFHALRFDSSRVKLADVLTQPYDKITPAMQEAYYQRSPHNLVRFELGRPEPTDSDSANVYTRAAEFLRQQQREGILRRDQRRVFLRLHPEVRPSSAPGKNDRPHRADRARQDLRLRRQGRLPPRADPGQTAGRPRQSSARHRTHSGQLFMLYEDPANADREPGVRRHRPRGPPTNPW